MSGSLASRVARIITQCDCNDADANPPGWMHFIFDSLKRYFVDFLKSVSMKFKYG